MDKSPQPGVPDGHLTAKTAILIQARSGSTRLPGKCFLPLPDPGGPSLLEWIFTRMIGTGLPVFFLVPEADEGIRSFCETKGWPVIPGPEEDVRERYRVAARRLGVETIVRATGDNPLTDPQNVLLCIEQFRRSRADLFSYTGLPIGLGVEVFSTSALSRDVEPVEPIHREHVSLHIKHHPELFRVEHLPDPRLHSALLDGITGFTSLRLTVDEEKDYRTMCAVTEGLSMKAGLEDLARLFLREPERFQGNSDVEQRQFNQKS